jgi:osmotically-inducible protein OsmY
MKVARLCVLLLLLLALPIGAQEPLSDRAIIDALETKLGSDEAVPSHLLDVYSRNGVVTLEGTVDNLIARDRATRNAEAIRGVRVVINHIIVKPVQRSDDELAKEIGWALQNGSSMDRHEIRVQVENQVATLTGTVDSWQEKAMAGNLTSGIKGLSGLNNNININYERRRPDPQVAADVRQRLKSDVLVNASRIAVTVKDGSVSLSGEVGSAAERSRAADDAWVVGTHSVDVRGLEVNPLFRNDSNRPRYVYRTDEELRDTVQDALRYDPRVDPSRIDIEVNNGEAVLTGTVESLAAKRAAHQDARNTAGIWVVRNHLKVRPAGQFTDEKIRWDVLRVLENDPWLEVNDISVRVFNRKAYLSGSVDSRAELERAAEIVARVPGVAAIQNNLNPPVVRHSRDDLELQQDIEERLAWSAFVNAEAVEVDVQNGVVTLSGTVEDFSEWRAAASNAIEAGAESVINHLKVRHGPASLRG